MRFSPRRVAHRALRGIGLDLLREATVDRLVSAASENVELARQIQFLASFNDTTAGRLLKMLPRSKAQLQQDLFAIAESEFSSEGFFVEFGAAGGIELSNTYLLENEFGWAGILAEPAHIWHAPLKSNRTCIVDFDCVWSQSGLLINFSEVADIPELSTISTFANTDFHRTSRSLAGHSYDVRTISLLDLLKRHNAPKRIDYLSIDTEGSEFDILAAFDFDAFDVRVITCEHNFSPKRGDIHALLTSKGFVRKMEAVSGFDDWYSRRP